MKFWRKKADLAEAVAAIMVLAAVIRSSEATTMMELTIEPKKASDTLKEVRIYKKRPEEENVVIEINLDTINSCAAVMDDKYYTFPETTLVTLSLLSNFIAFFNDWEIPVLNLAFALSILGFLIMHTGIG